MPCGSSDSAGFGSCPLRLTTPTGFATKSMVGGPTFEQLATTPIGTHLEAVWIDLLCVFGPVIDSTSQAIPHDASKNAPGVLAADAPIRVTRGGAQAPTSTDEAR